MEIVLRILFLKAMLDEYLANLDEHEERIDTLHLATKVIETYKKYDDYMKVSLEQNLEGSS